MIHAARCFLGLLLVFGVFAAKMTAQAAAMKDGRSDSVRMKVIYGDDDRKDLYQVKESRMLAWADSVVALFPESSVTLEPSGKQYSLSTHQFGSSNNLCKEEPFYEQPSGAFCSGFLVGHDIIATAGHCVKSAQDCADTKFVFGFAVHKAGESPQKAAATEVYGCKELIGRQQNSFGADWALVRVDHAVANHRPVELNRGSGISTGAPLAVIGHPSGLPLKVAAGAKVRDASPDGYFVANLDTYGGNSGSAVFNTDTGLVEGILVRGETDFVQKGSCWVSNRCPSEGCRGEDVTKIASVAPQIPPGGNLVASMRQMKSDPPQSLSRLLDEVEVASKSQFK